MPPNSKTIAVSDSDHRIEVTFFDTDANGIPDYKEPWFWLTVGRVVSRVVLTLAPGYTIAAKIAAAYLSSTAK